jgi:acetone carboxylase gamma subunit
MRVYDTLEITKIHGKEVFRCLKCGNVFGGIDEDYKNRALKNNFPLSKCQPKYLSNNTDKFVLREYSCPGCGVLIEVDMVAKKEKQIQSVKIKCIPK